MKKIEIFVSIASFCEPHLSFTVNSMLQMARHASRLHIGIVKQGGDLAINDCKGASISVLDIEPSQSGGACWARNLAMSMYRGENFYLQIDSHTLFEHNWDEILVENLADLYAYSKNPIISTRPQGFTFEDDGSTAKNRFTENTIILKPRKKIVESSSPAILFHAWAQKTCDHIVGYQLSAAFIFAPGDFVRRFPYDPMLYFHGEEQNLSIRCLTAGWDIYHISSVPLYHLYKHRKAGEARLHWDPNLEKERRIKVSDRKIIANRLLWTQLTSKYDTAYGNGNVRPVSYYLNGLGLELANSR